MEQEKRPKKKCTKCGIEKPLNLFFVTFSKSKYRVKSECKQCTAIAIKNRGKKYLKTKVKTSQSEAKRRQYYKDHWDDFKASRDKFYAINPMYFRDRYARIKLLRKLKPPTEKME